MYLHQKDLVCKRDSYRRLPQFSPSLVKSHNMFNKHKSEVLLLLK